jgi:hypothetical protein
LLIRTSKAFAPNDKVNLKLWTKNVDKLMIKEFEINAFNYYIKNRQEVSTAIELDGLTATRERVIESDLPPIRRNLRSVSFPNLKKERCICCRIHWEWNFQPCPDPERNSSPT